MEPLRQLGAKAALNVVVKTQIFLNQFVEVTEDIVRILIKEALQLGHLLVVVEVFFVLGIELVKHI